MLRSSTTSPCTPVPPLPKRRFRTPCVLIRPSMSPTSRCRRSRSPTSPDVSLRNCSRAEPSVSVPYPRELTIEKKMSRSVVLSWSPPEDQLRPVSQYHVCVDNSVKAVVPGTYKCKALIEDVFLDKFVNLSVRAMSEQGSSVDAQCTMAVGAEAPVAPQHVRVWSITPVGACVGWYPSNSNAEHILLLNAIKVGVCPPSVFQVQLQGLLPSTIYRVSIRTKHPKAVLEQRPVERCVDFKTLPKIGLPEPPKNVQVEAGPQPGTLLVSWTPVSSQPLPPSRAAVHSYLVFADGRNIAQVPSANADHVLLRLSDFADDPPLFITVRVRTREGTVSPDSNVIRVPRSIANLASNIATSLNSSTTQMNNLVSSMVNNQQQLQSLSLATNPIDLGVGAGVPGRHSGGLLTTMSAPSATLTRLGNTVTIGGSGTLPLRKGSAGGTLVPSYENQMLMNGGVVGSIKDLTQVGTSSVAI
ncbi:hypothetical protein L596_023554 [Steinernema carpocapsae]|uniref:Fibronectin type-III domain-containing protein n=1 Tax=Steinernema carpocapsae TaxID=34508 RepID=A0A4U5MDZ4_STECR|nr:hypothetical protein L596_023554 [Steinernema carpocapsae]